MPPTTRVYRKKGRYVRKSTNRKGKSLNPRQKKEVKMILNKHTELKSLDVPYIGTVSADLTGACYKWFSVGQGAASNQRIGDDIEVSYIQFKYDWFIADSYNIVRVLVFQWALDDASTVPTVADILGTASGAAPYNALLNFNNRDKYKILYDKRLLLQSTSTGSVSTPFSSGTITCRPSHKKMLYNTGATTGRYMIYTLLCSDSSAVGHPTISVIPRIVYRDS